MTNLAQYWKAVLAFIVPGVVTLGSAITAGSDGGNRITSTEWLTAAFACVLTAGAVYGKANADPDNRLAVAKVFPATDTDRYDHLR